MCHKSFQSSRPVLRHCTAFLLLAGLLALPAHAGTRFPIDSNHTTIGFEVPILGISKVVGQFSLCKGALIVPEGKDLTTAQFEITIDAASIDTGIDDRDNHLRGEDFFHVEAYPEITFVSERIEKKGEKDYVMVGDITVRGVTKKISIPFELTYHDDVVAGTARFPFDRTEFGVAWTRVMDDGQLFVGNVVEVEIYLMTRVGKPWEPGQEEPQGPTNEPDRGP
jgi:polyisoprenoid-binding protein YceI